jgi:hypothetical protein
MAARLLLQMPQARDRRSLTRPASFHNFPASVETDVLQSGTRTVTPDFYQVARPSLGNDAVMYELRGSLKYDGKIYDGVYQIGTRPSVSGNTEVIMHRFFLRDP